MDDFAGRILEELPVGVWVGKAPDAKVAYSNTSFGEIMGMGPVDESRVGDIPRTYRVFDQAGNPYPVDKLPFSRVLATGGRVVVEDMVIHRSDGERTRIRAFGHPLRDENGTITHVVVLFTDMTREAHAEAERASSEARLKLAVDHAPIALFSIDSQGIITLSEGAGLAALGVRSGELVGKSVFELYRDHPTIPDYIRQGLAGESFYYTVQVGDAVYDSWLTPVRAADGSVSGVLGVSHDMSELRRLQAAAIQNDRVMAMGTLAASVAHEINNPLTYVLYHLENLRAGLDRHVAALIDQPAPAEAAVALREELLPVCQGVERIADIVRELRSFSRTDEDRQTTIDVAAVVQSVLKLVRKDIEMRARLVTDLAPGVWVRANETRLAQVLMNLLINARQSLPEGRPERHEVGVVLTRQAEQVVIDVSDTGPGVPAADRDRVFEAFVTRKPAGEGTGLGLFVCRNIVRRLDGEIAVRDRPGGGAIFRVTLPAAVQPGARVRAGGEASMSLSGTRVLVIDDEPLLASVLCARLTAAGCHAEQINDATRAAEVLVGEQPFDLVYCDLMMTGMTGMELAELLVARAPERLSRMLYMTGGAFTETAAAFVAAHRESVVEKPFDILKETQRRLEGEGR